MGQILLQMRFKNVAWFRNISGIGPLIDLISTASAGCVGLKKKTVLNSTSLNNLKNTSDLRIPS